MSDDKPVNPAKEKVTWGEVCKQVGFADNLYRTCRGRLGDGFSPASPFGGAFSESDEGEGEVGEDFDKQLKKSALPVPPPPPDDWKHEPEGGFLDEFLYGDGVGKWVALGGVAAVAFVLWRKMTTKDTQPVAAPTVAPQPALSAVSALPLLPVDTDSKTVVY